MKIQKAPIWFALEKVLMMFDARHSRLTELIFTPFLIRPFGVLFGTAGAACVLGMGLAPASAESLIIYGSSTFTQELMQPHQSAIEAASKHKLTVISSKSSLGLLALFEGRANLAMISASLESEVTGLRKNNPTLPFERLRNFAISQTRVTFAIHPSNSVRVASLDKVRQVLRGQITNWRELGGHDGSIRIVVVRGGGGVGTVIESELLEGEPITASGTIYVQSGSQVLQVVAQEPAAIGLAQFALLQEWKLPELVTDRAIQQQLNLVTLGEPTSAMRAVIDATRSIAATNAR